MGTRGLYGIRKNGVDKTTYNHYDSYPEVLGEDIVGFIKTTTIEEMNRIYDKIEMVNDSFVPSDAELVAWKLTDKIGEKFDWYSFLREFQGNLDAYKGDLKYMMDDSDFILESLFCEWAYIINLDHNVLEIYKGFQTKPNDGRYVKKKEGEYYPCKLVATFSLKDIPENWEEIVTKRYATK
jgi:hypothetical protein